MKSFKKIFLIIAFSLPLLASCDSKNKIDKEDIGLQTPIELSKNELSFAPNGGTQTINVLNYEQIFLYELYIQIEPFKISESANSNKDQNKVEMEGISVELVDKTVITVTVSPSEGHREWYLSIGYKNASKTIKITQVL